MELNTVLAWVVGVSASASLFVHAFRFRFRFRGWVAVFCGLLALLGLGFAFFAEAAGYVAGAAWLVVFVLPAFGARWLGRLAMRQQYDRARLLARILAVLHPLDGWPKQPAYLDAMAQIERGDLDGARSRVEKLAGSDAKLARFLALNLLRAEGDWAGIRAALENGEEPGRLPRDPQTAALYVRALGETGDIDRMLSTYGRLADTPVGVASRQTVRLYVAALGGRPDIVAKLFGAGLRDATPAVRAYWMATAEWASGRRGGTLEALSRLADSDDLAMRAGARHRLQWHAAAEQVTEEHRALLDEMAREVEHEQQYGLTATPRSVATPVTWTLILVNLAFFALEVPGGAQDQANLIRLGALLAPVERLDGEWWRLLTAGFLHFGVVHLVLNVAGIWILGRYTERVWGRWALGLCYLAATFGANLLMLILWTASAREPTAAVGASGGVMGVLGAALAFASIEWKRTRAPLLRRHVGILASILVVQIVFDLMTPKVSSTIHLGGLGIGVLLGLALASRSRRAGAQPGRANAQPSGSISSAPK